MPKQEKVDLLALLQRARAVIVGEVAPLRAWAADPVMATGRQAQCMSTVHLIEASSLVSIDHSVTSVTALNDAQVLLSPDQPHKDLVTTCEQSLASRSNWNGPTLTDSQFSIALIYASNNSNNAAQAGALAFHDCT
jgi:hypothetical protein